jgi:hypothetical protein
MLVREVCTQLSLTFKLESMRLLKVEGRYLAVNIVGQTVFWWNSQRTLIPAVSHSWFMFHVHTLLVYVIFSVEITTCPPLWPITLCWKLWFRLGPLDLYCSWMKSNGIHIMVLDTWLIKQWCGRRNVLEGVLDTLWRWTVSNRLVPNEWRSIQNTWRIDIIYVAQNVTKPATMLRQRTYIGYYIVYIYIAFCLVFWHLVLYIPFPHLFVYCILPHLFIHIIVTCADYFVDFLHDDTLPTPGAGVRATSSGSTYRGRGGTWKHFFKSFRCVHSLCTIK